MGQSGSKKVVMPGVVYSEDWSMPDRFLPQTHDSSNHALFQRLPKAAERLSRYSEQIAGPRVTAGPEVEPYTWWERIGGVPLTASRFRPRQFYHPTTDFRKYTYDEMGPEERRLKAEWISRIINPNWVQATMIWVTLSLPAVVLPARYRMPYAIATANSTFFIEAIIQWMDAAVERQNLDDFLVAKEVWYIKNVETAQLKIVTMDPKLTNDQMSTKRALDKAEALEMQLAALETTGMRSVGPSEEELEKIMRGVPLDEAGREAWNKGQGAAAVKRQRQEPAPEYSLPHHRTAQGLFSDPSGRI